jgi:hypothetical protein
MKYVVFSLFKYVEYAITASLFFLLAHMVTPQEYGQAVPAFLAISYSAFAALGANQVLIKWHAICDEPKLRTFFIEHALIVAVLSGTLVWLAFSALMGSEVRYFAGAIAALKLLQEAMVNALRARKIVTRINAIYLAFAGTFALCYFCYVTSVYSFFLYWMVSLALSVVVAIVFLALEKIPWLGPQEWLAYQKIYWRNLLFDGLKLASLGAILPLYLSFDRILLMQLHTSDTLVGTLQLADNIATVLGFAVTPVLYVATPILLERLKAGSLSFSRFYSISYLCLAGLLLAALLGLIPLTLLSRQFFPHYLQLQAPLALYLMSRLLHLGLFSSNLLCMVCSKEFLYIKVTYLWFLGLVAALLSNALFGDPQQLYWQMPTTILVILLGVHLNLFLILRQGNFGRLGERTGSTEAPPQAPIGN